MTDIKRILTIDSNIFVGAAKVDEPYRKKCLDLLKMVPDTFVLSEPSIIYQEVCGTIARRVGDLEAKSFAQQLDKFVPSKLLFVCDKEFCLSSYSLCAEYGIYSIDALYFNAAISSGGILVSLDRVDFIDKIRKNRHDIETYHVSDFPYY
ncbi:MAG: PIN domain-containing protein [Nitrososphaerales archaeon]